jgi:hypothetical protein
MTRSPIAFVIRVFRCHSGHVLLAISWSFILFVLVRTPITHPQLVDCVPANPYEMYTITEVLRVWPIWIRVIGLAHLPSMLVTMGVTKLIQAIFSLSCGPTAKVELPLLFAFSAIQWLFVGYILQSLFRRWRART